MLESFPGGSSRPSQERLESRDGRAVSLVPERISTTWPERPHSSASFPVLSASDNRPLCQRRCVCCFSAQQNETSGELLKGSQSIPFVRGRISKTAALGCFFFIILFIRIPEAFANLPLLAVLLSGHMMWAHWGGFIIIR